MATIDVLDLHQKVSLQNDIKTEILRIPWTQISYNEFFWSYMKQNIPIVLSNISTDWLCTKWIDTNKKTQTALTENNINIDFNYLKEKIENTVVPVADCNNVYFNSHKKIDMQFHDFLNYWNDKQKAILNNNEVLNKQTMENKTNLYLKDWHLQAQMPAYNFYQVPKHFASDWLNEYLVGTKRDDYRFVYMGPKESWTPFHVDVFGSFSWSANIVGVKKWIFLAPGEEKKLEDQLGNLPFQIDELNLSAKDIKYFSLLQRESEAVFVPSGWYHQVSNVTDTISINHNWFNACNLQRIWLNLCNNMEKVIAEIQDCRQMDNFESHCQTMLRASFGINYIDFLDILEYIVEKRLKNFNNGNIQSMSSKYLLFNKYDLNDFHIRYDLKTVNKVVHLMLKNTIVCDSRVLLYRRCLRLIESTKDIQI